jgi:FkbM family methyltransferase
MGNIVEDNVVQQATDWQLIYKSLVALSFPSVPTVKPRVELVFVVPGNWSTWTGKDIETQGLGGSETWAVEMAVHLRQWLPPNSVVFFCNCTSASEYRGVHFFPLEQYEALMATHAVGICIVSRFSQYVFAPLHTECDRVILYLHDLGPTGNILPVHAKLTHVFCLSPWHKDLFSTNFASHASRTNSLGYGIDVNMWKPGKKRQHSFIYSSFPDRGLVVLLRMWPAIRAMWPDSTLQIFCNLAHQHVRRVSATVMAEIDALLLKNPAGITVRGWVAKHVLAHAYGEAQYWLYPCTFDETFCLTALEAAASGTVGIAPPRAALQHMPLLFVHGDAATQEWQDAALDMLRRVDTNSTLYASVVAHSVGVARERPWQRQALLLAQQAGITLDAQRTSQLFVQPYHTPCAVQEHVRSQMSGRLFSTVASPSDHSAIEYNYVTHVLQKAASPHTVVASFLNTSSSGFVETPSPMLELLRGVEPDRALSPNRGYALHTYFVWTDANDNSLHLLPKLPLVERLQFEAEAEWYHLINTSPLLWMNYYEWSPARPPTVLVHTVTSLSDYKSLLLHAIKQSVEATARLFAGRLQPGCLDGPTHPNVQALTVHEHLEKLSTSRKHFLDLRVQLQRMKEQGFNPRVIYDIGACVLEWFYAAQDVWPAATIIAFDAVPAMEALYQRSNVQYHIGLLGEEDGKEVTFFQNEWLPFGNSRFREAGATAQLFPFENSTRQSLQTLEKVVEARGFPPPDLIKIDVQGSELAVITGGASTFARAARVIVELMDEGYNTGAPHRQQVVDQLTRLSFKPVTPLSAKLPSHASDYEFVNTRATPLDTLFF